MEAWNTGAPPTAGVYVASIEGQRTDMRRNYAHDSGWSAPYYCDDPEHIAERARRTPSESQASAIQWREVVRS